MSDMETQLICTNCFARSADSHDGWENAEYGDLCPECAFSDVARAGVETNGVGAIAEAIGANKK